jgi:hypothetical protein
VDEFFAVGKFIRAGLGLKLEDRLRPLEASRRASSSLTHDSGMITLPMAVGA